MSLPSITKELEKILDHFEPIANAAYPGYDRGTLFAEVKHFSESWLLEELRKAMEEFRRKRNNS